MKILEAASVDVVTLANNHLMDYGREGLDDTIATLDAAGIAWFGAGERDKVARRPLTIERNGVRLGFLGYYFQAPPDMLEPEAMYAKSRRPGVAGCFEDLDCMKKQVREDVRKLVHKVDAVITYFHWGKEGELVPIQVTTWPDAPFQPFVLEGEARTAALARIAELSMPFASTLPQLRGAG